MGGIFGIFDIVVYAIWEFSWTNDLLRSIPSVLTLPYLRGNSESKMPHTNRKKKSSNAGDKKPLPKVVHTKRQQIDDEDGWTHVIDTPRNTKLQLKIKEGQVLHAGDFERDGVSYVTRTLEELRGDLEYYTKQWESGEGCEKLKELLVGKAKDGERMRVEDVVCLGLGSLQSSRREGRRASLTQLAALRTIIQALGKSPIPERSEPQQIEANCLRSWRRKAVLHIPRSPIHTPRQRIPLLPRLHSRRRSPGIRTYHEEELRVCYSLLCGCL